MKLTPLLVLARAGRALAAFALVIGLTGCGAGGNGSTDITSATSNGDGASGAAAVTTPALATVGPPAPAAGKASSPTSRRVLVAFKAGLSEAHRQQALSATGTRVLGGIAGTNVVVVAVPPGRDESDVADTFRGMPEVKFAEADALVPLAMTANDPYYSASWHLPKVGAPTAWDVTTGSTSVTIAICDTGVEATHPDLSPQLVAGWNVPSSSSDTSDVNGHGTGTAGTAGAVGNNGVGVTGVAWRSRLMPVRVTNDATGVAYLSDVASGITWAADHGARVANVSFDAATSSAVQTAGQYMMTKGGVVTVAAGNSATSMTQADSPYLLVVSGTDKNDVLATWSSYGTNVDLCAPGDSILSTYPGGQYAYWTGTSFSAPLVAGAAALVLSVNPGLTGAQVRDILKASADDLGTAGWDSKYGAGRLNVSRAVSQAAVTTPTAPPTVSFAAPLAGATLSGVVTVSVNASSTAGVGSVTLTIDGATLATDTASPYAFSWDTKTAANGSHTLTAVAKDVNGLSTSTSLTVTVGNVGDTTAPTVAITSPAAGARLSGTTVSVKVSATDNVKVTKVELYVDGLLTGTSTTSPFTVSWNIKSVATGSHTLVCKAYDAAGNVGTSASVSVTR